MGGFLRDGLRDDLLGVLDEGSGFTAAVTSIHGAGSVPVQFSSGHLSLSLLSRHLSSVVVLRDRLRDGPAC